MEEVLTVTVKDHRNQTVQVNATLSTLLSSVVVEATRLLSIPGSCPEVSHAQSPTTLPSTHLKPLGLSTADWYKADLTHITHQR